MERTNSQPLCIVGLLLAFLEVEEAGKSPWIWSMRVSGPMGKQKSFSIFPLQPGSSTSRPFPTTLCWASWGRT